MELEHAMQGRETEAQYNFSLTNDSAPFMVNWMPVIAAVLVDLQNGLAVSEISARFHNALAEAAVAVARRLGQNRVVLSGGCFQNHYLTERTVMRLREENIHVYWHQRVPPNDGGVALGQVMAARGNYQLK
jgi:hydrogenase maturation protein HypF